MMRGIVLDTNILINYWKKSRRLWRDKSPGPSEVASWSTQLIRLERTNATVTPVRIEFLCGVTDRDELNLARADLKPFVAVDRGRIIQADWREAYRLAEWIPPKGTRRNLGDCLIRAIAKRLGYEVRTEDKGMPR